MVKLVTFIVFILFDLIEAINFAVNCNQYSMGIEFWAKLFFIIWILSWFIKLSLKLLDLTKQRYIEKLKQCARMDVENSK